MTTAASSAISPITVTRVLPQWMVSRPDAAAAGAPVLDAALAPPRGVVADMLALLREVSEGRLGRRWARMISAARKSPAIRANSTDEWMAGWGSR
ncbi:hypothetical protein BCY76_008630 [Nesterenkonia sp. PF2B19]|nr:hypothetical protein BCY76_008630 [Nesterenkonia sp. PF2B19]